MASLTQPHGICGFCVYSVQVIKTMLLRATSSSVTISTSHHPSLPLSLSPFPDLKHTYSTNPSNHRFYPIHRTAHWTSNGLPSRTAYHSAFCFVLVFPLSSFSSRVYRIQIFDHTEIRMLGNELFKPWTETWGFGRGIIHSDMNIY